MPLAEKFFFGLALVSAYVLASAVSFLVAYAITGKEFFLGIKAYDFVSMCIMSSVVLALALMILYARSLPEAAMETSQQKGEGE
jgi:high-affinity Fe2+/Pb2+ permease